MDREVLAKQTARPKSGACMGQDLLADLDVFRGKDGCIQVRGY